MGCMGRSVRCCLSRRKNFSPYTGRTQSHPPNGFLDCGMNTEAHNPRRFGWRIPEYVCEVCIKSDEDAPLLDGHNPHVLVVCTREPDLYCGHGIVAQIADRPRVQRRQILVQRESHASESTTSSAAKAAAYPRQARRSSAV